MATKPEEKLLLPRKLTAENGAKYALIGEFFEDYQYVDPDSYEIKTGKVAVRWDTIKAIWAKAVDHFELLDKQKSESMVPGSEVTNDDREPKA